ncbi:MAG: hypothetical protein UV67_C0017G0024 [Parcubacteria group bacterium GW2011_GWC1_43_12]|nr:MAG: hypothetical protein UV67_C0017G0024 [Parcubacteria group bacterium GW2011_GWC1_43_12]
MRTYEIYANLRTYERIKSDCSHVRKFSIKFALFVLYNKKSALQAQMINQFLVDSFWFISFDFAIN